MRNNIEINEVLKSLHERLQVVEDMDTFMTLLNAKGINYPLFSGMDSDTLRANITCAKSCYVELIQFFQNYEILKK